MMIEIKTSTTTKKKKVNRKTHKTLHKKYRFFGGDLWGLLGKSFRDNNIVQKIAKITYKSILGSLNSENNIFDYDQKQKLLNRFPKEYTHKFNKNFIYDVAQESEQRMSSHGKKSYSAGGQTRILRSKLVLFYGGGRIRLPTFKIYSKFRDTRNREDQLTILRRRLGQSCNYITKLETRADIFFFRIGFFHSIYEARKFCYLRRARIKNFSKFLMPWFRIKIFEICFVIFYKKLQKFFIYNLEKKRIFVPSWVNISITFMRAFIIYYPSRGVYPTNNMSGSSLKVFKIGF